MSIAISGNTPLPSAAATAATSPKGTAKSGGADQQNATQISNQLTTTNPDGSSTTVITYADGTTTTTTQAAPPVQQTAAKTSQPAQTGPASIGGLLDPANSGQNATLLAAQEKALAPS